MRGDVEELDLVRVVGQELLQATPVVRQLLFLEADDVGGHRDDVVLAKEAYRLSVHRGRAPLANERERCLARRLHSEQESNDPRLLVQVQDVPVPDDVPCAGRAHERHGDVLGDERLAELAPDPTGRGRVLVGEVEDRDPVLAVQAGDLGGELVRITMPPPGPEAALPAVVARVRAATRQLDDDSTPPAPVAVVGVIDELPADAVPVQIGDDRCGGSRVGGAVDPVGDTGDRLEREAARQRVEQGPRCLLAFATDDDVDLRLLGEDLAPVIRRKHASVDDADRRPASPHCARDLRDDRVTRRRAGVADQHGIGPERSDAGEDVGRSERPELAVDEHDVVPGIDQRPPDGEEAERWKVIVGDPAADRGVGDVEQEESHARPFSGADAGPQDLASERTHARCPMGRAVAARS